ncbi:MAG: translation initiation factor IF-2 [Kyrpidia tusciae]|nr:translation initiation factor IF-2 [Kyrpidia tusciae]
MSQKLRVYEYAKQLNMSSKEIITILKRLGVSVNNHMSVMDQEMINQVEQFFADVKARASRKNEEQARRAAKGAASGPGETARTASPASGPTPSRNQRSGGRGRADQPRREHGNGPRDGNRSNHAERRTAQSGNGGNHERRSEGAQRSGDEGQRAGGSQRSGGNGQKTGGQRSGNGGQRTGGSRSAVGSGRRNGSGDRSRPAGKGAGPGGRRDATAAMVIDQYEDLDAPVIRGERIVRKSKPSPKGDKDNRKVAPPSRSQQRRERRAQREAADAPKQVVVEGPMSVGDFAKTIKKEPADVIKKLLFLGVMATINQEIDVDAMTLVAQEYGIELQVKEPRDEEMEELLWETDKPEDLVPRPPVVTIMGHVDHGKTTLLDAIRQTNVTAQEAGGITQHIGAYQVEVGGKRITFLDTPGHEAFTSMRARGAQVTDVCVLVVAADDGVMPQTVEAINHAKAAGVPILVAVNKMDKPDANPDRVKQELTEHGLVPEEWGGDTIFVPVSALRKQGIEDLLEMILLVAEMAELKANPSARPRGTVIEAELDKGRGPVATVLIQNGTLRVGDIVVAGTTFGRVRAMINDRGRRVKEAGPSTPVEILGLGGVPMAGDAFVVYDDERKARLLAEKRQTKQRAEELKSQTKVTLDDLYKQIQEGQVKELNVVLKADVQGSVEALVSALERIDIEGVRVRVIHHGVGAITETDILLASASNAIVIGFNVRPEPGARQMAEAEKVDIRLYRVIYNVIEEIEAALRGMLDPEYREVILGRAEVRQTFKVSKVGTIAGCYVVEGKVQRGASARVVRDGIVIHEGTIDSLKRFKDDVREVAEGYECGMTLERFNDIKEGDIIEVFTMEAVKV